MAIPDYQSIMLPLLRQLKDKKEHSLHDCIDSLAKEFNLSEEERRQVLPSGQQEVFVNRVGWARTYLKKAGLLERPRRGFFKISQRGLEVLSQNPQNIDVKFLKKFPEFLEFQSVKKEKVIEEKDDSSSTPEESIESAHQNLKAELASELLGQLKSNSPALFEKTVVELLLKMGYGGSRKDAGEAIGRSGDEGIDGIIKEDRLGLDIIYIQAKRWENQVGRPEIQKFAGALQGKRARKGIFITTSTFSKEAMEYAANIETKIILIDGNELAGFMIDNNIGVTPVATYEIKRLDTDYFTD